MRTLRPILLPITAAAALSFAYPAKANLITNPGFENQPLGTGWTFFISGVTSDPLVVHTGAHAAFLSSASGATMSQSVATTTGTTYTIDFFAKPQVNGQNLSINFGSTVFNYLFTGPGYHEVTFNATATGASTNLSFHDATGGFVFIDDVSVEPAGVGVPDGGTTVSLLGCAFLGLAALRRKLSC